MPVLPLLLLLFIALPFVELALLLYMAEWTGWQFTLMMVIVTGVVGSLLARSQGWRTYTRIQEELAEGHLPGQSLLDAVMIFIAGALLLTPGILTDAWGLSMLVPPCRAFYRRRLIARFRSRFKVHPVTPDSWGGDEPHSEVIDSYVIDSSTEADDRQIGSD
jgi:UPF0716 protein FxsA